MTQRATSQAATATPAIVQREEPRAEAAGLATLARVALAPGDLVIHADYGLGRLERLVSLEGEHVSDLFEITYRDSKLMVPVEDAGLLSRYGPAEAEIRLDRIGGQSWSKRRARALRRVGAMARQLVGIAARRVLVEAPIIKAGKRDISAFAKAAPFGLTPDQGAAVESIFADLASGRPMDRLVCGDVGSGKTEVALRAAFVAARAGHQVAIIAPTTLLSRQHCETFTRRLARWPIRIAHVSRLAGEGKAALDGIADGEVGIAIGTHALLSRDVAFMRLGLLIIDEEHRFGVAHKERLKQMREGVHVLTLTATPIPRTLQLTLSSVRDLSLIQTPPPRRHPVETRVIVADPAEITGALRSEKARGGQSFYVCPRIADLGGISNMLSEHAPELAVAVAHGRLAPRELDGLMQAFDAREIDVLLSTTIIESGLDVASANTLVVHDAHKLGLAQLYQLRGRVGRSDVPAHALLTTPADTEISATAKRRLEVVASIGMVGAGISLAGHDMDIRGAGNVLGDEQSGHIREIGFDLFQRLLRRAIAAIQGDGAKDWTEIWVPRLALGIDARIPAAYVEDPGERMELYWRAGHADGEASALELASEFEDRHGPPPQSVRDALALCALRARCVEAGIAEIKAGPRGAILLRAGGRWARTAATLNGRPARIDRGGRLIVKWSRKTGAERLAGVNSLIDAILASARGAASATAQGRAGPPHG